MMSQDELSELLILFETGFLSDKIVKALFYYTVGLKKIDEEILREALIFLRAVEKAKDNFPPIIIEKDTYFNLIIYQLVLSTYSELEEKNLITEIAEMREKLEAIISRKSINEKLDGVFKFFNKISEKTLEKGNNFFKSLECHKHYVNDKRAIELAIERILSQEHLLERLRAEEFPTNTQEKVISLLLKISSNIYRKLAYLSEENVDLIKLPPELQEQLTQILQINAERYNQLISFTYKISELLEASNIRHFPLGVHYALESIISDFQKDALIIVSLSNESNLSYLDLPTILGTILKYALDKEEMVKFRDDMCQHILIFNIPKLERDNLFLHSSIANRIGSYLLEYYDAFLKIVSSKNFSDFASFLSPFNLEDLEKQEIEKVRIAEQYLKKIKNWITTVASDLLLTQIFGPSYMFSFFKYTFDTDNQESEVPLKSRLKIIIEEMKQLNYIRNVEIRKEIEKIEKYAIYDSFANKEVLNLISKIKEEIKKITEGKRYTLELFEEEVPFLISSISNLIPPNEILDFKRRTSRPAKIISILNASWLLKLSHINEVYKLLNAKTSKEKSQVDIKLDSLIQKSIELSEIHRRMRGSTK
ncbi:MAG: hypothetical protein KIH08_04035 [Candidatus Freyarchaeota archaeon]|nr:hypothetical protein [Candidatus Jordarchaeia archaeon]MBS7269334.1 hypothetical protein [Candidatus Jordarchaeia archaeon]MBS7278631.1 hypothetical protein [Candidatus Jordarchaeia archaeon]